MKKSLQALLLLAACAGSLAGPPARAGSGYLALSAGSFQGAFSDVSGTSRKAGFRIAGGFQMSPAWDFEIGVARRQGYDANANLVALDPSVRVSTTSVDFSPVFRLPIKGGLSLDLALGAALTSTRAAIPVRHSRATTLASHRDITPRVAAGLEWAAGETVSWQLGYERIGPVGSNGSGTGTSRATGRSILQGVTLGLIVHF